jgi:hypothetical protein
MGGPCAVSSQSLRILPVTRHRRSGGQATTRQRWFGRTVIGMPTSSYPEAGGRGSCRTAPTAETGSAGASPSPESPFPVEDFNELPQLQPWLGERLVRSPDVFARVGRIDRSVERSRCARRSDRPKQPRMSLSASVGSAEAAGESPRGSSSVRLSPSARQRIRGKLCQQNLPLFALCAGRPIAGPAAPAVRVQGRAG